MNECIWRAGKSNNEYAFLDDTQMKCKKGLKIQSNCKK